MSGGDYALAVAKFFGWLALGAWIVFSVLTALASPLYTAGGADVGVWLICFHWLAAAAVVLAMIASVHLHRRMPALSLALSWLTPVAGSALWIAFYAFYNAILCECCVELPW